MQEFQKVSQGDKIRRYRKRQSFLHRYRSLGDYQRRRQTMEKFNSARNVTKKDWGD